MLSSFTKNKNTVVEKISQLRRKRCCGQKIILEDSKVPSIRQRQNLPKRLLSSKRKNYNWGYGKCRDIERISFQRSKEPQSFIFRTTNPLVDQISYRAFFYYFFFTLFIAVPTNKNIKNTTRYFLQKSTSLKISP